MHKRIKTQLGIAFATIISTAQQQMFDISAPNKKKTEHENSSKPALKLAGNSNLLQSPNWLTWQIIAGKE